MGIRPRGGGGGGGGARLGGATGGGEGGGMEGQRRVACQDSEAAPRKAFFLPASPPRGLPPARIAFSVRISKAAPGLFRSGNLILPWVYFSTLENSQRRTRARAAPSLLTPPPAVPVLPGPRGAPRVGRPPRRGGLGGAALGSSRICPTRDPGARRCWGRRQGTRRERGTPVLSAG